MTGFEQALVDYRAALELAAPTATTDVQRLLYRLFATDLAHIERLYRDTRDPHACRSLLKSGKILHDIDLLVGDAVVPLRAAFDRLLRLAAD